MMHVCRWRWWWWYALRISLPNHIFSFLPSQTGLQLGLFTPSFCSSHLHFFLLFIFLKYPSSHSHLHHPPLHATSPTPVWILYFLLSKKRNFISIGASTKCMKSKNLRVTDNVVDNLHISSHLSLFYSLQSYLKQSWSTIILLFIIVFHYNVMCCCRSHLMLFIIWKREPILITSVIYIV